MMLNTADRVYTIDPSGLSVGALAANSWAGFDSPVQEVILQGGQKYIGGKTSDPWSDTAFVTKASGRDQEISFKMAQTYQGFSVYLRYDGESAVVFKVDKGGNTFSANFARYVNRINQTKDVGFDTYVPFVFGLPSGGNTSLSALVGTTFALSDVWTLGAVGDLFYAKFNGTTFWTGRFWTHAKPGKIAVLFPSNASVGYRDVTCTFKPSSVAYSDFDNFVLDPRDWGLKDNRTTGSITGGTNSLVVADATGFNVGDSIIVEIKSAADGGVFGTEGVGGTWPKRSYANFASLPDAATWRSTVSQGSDGFVWLRDTTTVYINYLNNGVPTWGEFSPVTQDYFVYQNVVMPRALQTKITAKSGNTLTLADNATVTATGANVYLDSTPAWQGILDGNAIIGTQASTFGAVHPDWYAVRKHVTIKFPPGQFVLRSEFSISQTEYWTIRGETRDSTIIKSPRGCNDFWVSHYGSYNEWLSLSFEGNAGESGYCHDADWQFGRFNWTITLLGNRQSGINGEQYGKLYDMKFTNCFGGPVVALVHYTRVYDCVAYQTAGNLQRYVTWFYGSAYCIDTFFDRCEYYADRTGTAFEIFQAEGGGFRNCTSVNGYFSSNFSGGNFLWENLKVDIDLSKNPTRDWMSANNYIFNINNNIGPGAETAAVLQSGGRIVNPDITIRQRASDGLMKSGIAVNSGCPNIRITGTHPAKPGKGVITLVKTVNGDWGEKFAIRADTSSIIEGIRVVGGQGGAAQYADIQNNLTTPALASTKNNVAESIYVYDPAIPGHVNVMGQNGNITNEAYEALP